MYWAMGVEPTKLTASMSGCSRIRSTADLVALHDVEHAVGQAGLLEQVGQEQRHGRVLLAGLEHEGVARRDGVGEHPHRHHGGEVERRDAGHDAERLLDGVHVDAARDALRVAALQHGRDAAGELDVLDAARELAGRVAGHLAVLDRHAARRSRPGGSTTSSRNVNMTSARRESDVARHVGEGGLGRRDGVVDLRHGREADRGLLLAGGGVVDRPRCGRRPTGRAIR